MDTVTSILLKVLKGGNMIRITNKETKEKIVGILVDNKKTRNFNIIEIFTNNTNFIGDLFSKTSKQKKTVSLMHNNVSLISTKEYNFFKSIITKSMRNELKKEILVLYRKLIYRIDESIKNSEGITVNLLRVGYRMYPTKKIEIFNKIVTTNVYTNTTIPPDFKGINAIMLRTP